ncbi:MAG: hypothetical protein M3067_05950 [Chloroflexota bacterium]|nr:hypothetical protein [Chloroflexota bacterium]MDQ6898243.1 hypothetical protein [Candidatus Dormibacteraeota bacterium]
MPEVGIAEAAVRLGVSVDTVRRRLATGQLTGERDPGVTGKWRVQVPEAPARTANVDQVVDLRGERDQLLRMLESERQRHAEAERELRVLLGQSQELAQRMLPAHVEAPSEPAGETKPQRRSWFRRMVQ